MRSRDLKITRIGNSKGVRLPADTLKRYLIEDSVVMEERSDGILLRWPGPSVHKLSWAETAEQMALAEADGGDEDWSDWDNLPDGLEEIPWDLEDTSLQVAEPAAIYGKSRRRGEPLRQYEVHWAELQPVVGAEMGKTRPVVIISLNEMNDRLKTVTVCPITRKLHPSWRNRLPFKAGQVAGELAVDHIRGLSKLRFGKKIDALGYADATALRRLITEMYGE